MLPTGTVNGSYGNGPRLELSSRPCCPGACLLCNALSGQVRSWQTRTMDT